MSMRNHQLGYVPLRGGIAIYNPNVNKVGTLGCIATSDGIDRWIISCYHVLCRLNGDVCGDNEPIVYDKNERMIARNSLEKADVRLDCAAAKVENGISAVGEVLGMGKLSQPVEPRVGMRVLKSGSATGLTEGIITAIQSERVEIGILPEFPEDYTLTAVGDSGALWVSRDELAPVALHYEGSTSGKPQAFVVRISDVLTRLRLQILI